MSEMIRVEICAPEKLKLELEAQEVLCPGEDGIFSVRYGHTPLLTTLVPGVILVKDKAGEEQFYATSGGFAEIEPDKVLVLADSYEAGTDVDEERAKQAEERAQMRLRKPEPETDMKRAELALYKAMARLKAARRVGY
ncbi:MAG TPA: ATP synthase F1 subunit epsilon [Candidatus Hydrogenedentes bacterium]|nr:ATP synthase F1 subunit epsilon [Candidatus Hydrogenedentota bacterium]